MRIWADELLSDLEMLSPGLGEGEAIITLVDQCTCFVFRKGEAVTFNGSILCRKKTELNVTGAVDAKSTLKLFRMLGRKEFEVEETDGPPPQVAFKSPKIRFSLFKQENGEINQPVDHVDDPAEWMPFPMEIWQAVEVGLSSFGENAVPDGFHFTEESIVASEPRENPQAIRFRMETGFDRPLSISGDVLRKIAHLNLRKHSVTANWIHFRNEAGLTVSCRHYDYDGPPPSAFGFKGYLLKLPEDAGKDAVLAGLVAKENKLSPNLRATLSKDKLEIESESVRTNYSGTVAVKYSGPRMKFSLPADTLARIISNNTHVLISQVPFALKLVGADWEHVMALGHPEATTEFAQREN